ncbi:dihydrofolate reductase [Candidatus Saccharibacteria bacterium]|nr:dihydrofolate reductase [Candidatus Saccharibacteria bacterium]
MRKLIILTFISLDGVMQAPGGKGEDPSGGFNLEGWTVPYFDDVAGQVMDKQMTPPFDLLLGRKTYDIFAGYWPQQQNETSDAFNKATKYVVSNGDVDTSWDKTVQISGDVASEIQALKDQDGPDLQVHGSSNLIQTLLRGDLADELWLKIFPITLGKGKRLFGEGTVPAAYTLTDSLVTPSGVIVASYKRDGEVRTGSFN